MLKLNHFSNSRPNLMNKICLRSLGPGLVALAGPWIGKTFSGRQMSSHCPFKSFLQIKETNRENISGDFLIQPRLSEYVLKDGVSPNPNWQHEEKFLTETRFNILKVAFRITLCCLLHSLAPKVLKATDANLLVIIIFQRGVSRDFLYSQGLCPSVCNLLSFL